VQAGSITRATGVSWRRIASDGFERLLGKGLFYGASRSEAGITQGKDIDLFDRHSGTAHRVDSAGVFVFIGADAETGWLPDAIPRGPRGDVITGDAVARSGRWPLPRDPDLLAASVPGIFAAGDVRASPAKRVAAAVGGGSAAIAFVHQFLAGRPRANVMGSAASRSWPNDSQPLRARLTPAQRPSCCASAR
jgi:hypothetical protein